MNVLIRCIVICGFMFSTASVLKSFDMALLGHLNQANDQKNIFISGLSVKHALALAANGANGQTQKEILKTLGGISIEKQNNKAQEIITNFNIEDPHVVLHMANSIWYNKDLQINNTFQTIATSQYLAQISPIIDAQTINNWVAKQTDQKINKIIDFVSPDVAMILLNAVYFDGKWTKPFDPEKTKDHTFTAFDKEESIVSMMTKTDNFLYNKESSKFTAIKLPYGGSFDAIIYLPKEETKKDLTSLITSFEEKPKTMFEGLKEEKVILSVPKFKIEFEEELKQTLDNLGIKQAFDENRADFSKLVLNASPFVASVVHKTAIDFNESGTKAAAVTQVTFQTKSLSFKETPTMTVDRPFLIIIADKKNNIIFTGVIKKLQK